MLGKSALLVIGGHGTIGLPTPVSAALTEACYCFAASCLHNQIRDTRCHPVGTGHADCRRTAISAGPSSRLIRRQRNHPVSGCPVSRYRRLRSGFDATDSVPQAAAPATSTWLIDVVGSVSSLDPCSLSLTPTDPGVIGSVGDVAAVVVPSVERSHRSAEPGPECKCSENFSPPFDDNAGSSGWLQWAADGYPVVMPASRSGPAKKTRPGRVGVPMPVVRRSTALVREFKCHRRIIHRAPVLITPALRIQHIDQRRLVCIQRPRRAERHRVEPGGAQLTDVNGFRERLRRRPSASRLSRSR